MRVEILTDPGMALRGARMLDAMIAAAPIEARVRNSYVGDCEILMVYGTGHPIRRPWWRQHLKNGGRCIGWDLGYWKHKDDGTCRMRVTLDHDHPQAFIRPEDGARWASEGISLREDFNAKGPIVLVGLGQKSVRLHSLHPLEWETRAIKRLQKEFPGRSIVFRPKRPGDARPPMLKFAKDGPIEDVIRGASLVVCRHSNVSVDACIAGIPVQCEDGAAVALYRDNPAPTPAQRLAFLQSLAHWQYKPEEASQAWTYLLSRLSA